MENGIGRALILALAVLSMTLVSAQEPSFDVASVKVTASDEANPNRWARYRPGDVNTHASPLRWILPVAFGVPGDLARVKLDFTRVSRDLLERTYFDIQAKGSPTGDQAAMLRTLLRDRFGLKWHSETRTVPIRLPLVDLPIVDGTGLKGTYSWDFVILQTPRNLSEFSATLRDALEDQLGLTLTRTTGPWEVIVIDRVQMPTPN